MLVCKACWDVFNYTMGDAAIMDHCPKPKCMNNELDDIDEAILPTMMVLQKKGYFADNSSSCHFYDFGTALTPTCFIVFDEQVRLIDLPKPPEGFKYEAFGDDRVCMRKIYKAESQFDLHEEILSTSIDLLRWARSIGGVPMGEEYTDDNPPQWVVDERDREEDHGRLK
jgi:hypothetical protein